VRQINSSRYFTKDNMNLKSKQINKAYNTLAKAHSKLKDVQLSVVTSCEHKEVGECSYRESTTFSYAYPPERVCLNCGLTEVRLDKTEADSLQRAMEQLSAAKGMS
jgi:hypothetical protein